jgi:hypothetical protein
MLRAAMSFAGGYCRRGCARAPCIHPDNADMASEDEQDYGSQVFPEISHRLHPHEKPKL